MWKLSLKTSWISIKFKIKFNVKRKFHLIWMWYCSFSHFLEKTRENGQNHTFIFNFISVLLSLHHNHPCFIYKVIIHITKYHNIQGWSCRGWSVSPCARVWRGRGSEHCCTLFLLLLRSIVGRQRVSVNFFIAYCLNSSHAWFYILQCIVDTDLRAWLLVKLDRTARKRMA